MTLLRRTLTLIALMIWQGGFMFYGGVVVPVGTQVLGSHRAMSLVTQPVTNCLNAAGTAALVLWAWEVLSGATRWRKQCVALWLLLALALAAQFLLHRQLDEFMLREAYIIPELEQFQRQHQYYLIISTLQWALAIALVVFTLLKWKEEDRSAT